MDRRTDVGKRFFRGRAQQGGVAERKAIPGASEPPLVSYALPASCPSFFALRPDWIVNIARPGEAASTRFVPRIAPIRSSGMKIIGRRCRLCGRPALAQLGAALAAGVARGIVLMDASYGTNSALRAGIGALALTYVAAILPTVKVRAVGDPDRHVSAKQLALSLPDHTWRTRRLGRSAALALCPRCGCAPRRSGVPPHARKRRC
jgi:hypothetical protein